MHIRNGSGGRWAVILGLGGLVLLALVAVHSISSMIWAVQGVRSDVDLAAEAIGSGDLAGATDAVVALVDSSTELATVSQSGLWGVASHAPVVGPTVSALGVMSSAVALMSTDLSAVLARLAAAGSNSARVAALAEAAPELTALERSALAAEVSLARIEPAGLMFGLDTQARDLQGALPRVVSFASRASEASEVLPRLVGMNGRTTWLVMLQNAAEARGSGGLFSAYALVEFDRGEVRIAEANTRKAGLDDESIPVVPEIPFASVVESSSTLLWGKYLGEWASFNLSADFPTVARLAAAGMAQRGTPIDGVIALDAEVVGALLAGTGPVEHQGVVIDRETAPAFFLAGIYEDFPGFADAEAKDRLAMGLMYATVDSLLKRPLNLPGLATSVAPLIGEGHIKAWSPDPQVEAFFIDIGVAGDIDTLDPGSAVVVFNNAVGGKLDSYLTTDVVAERAVCTVVDGVVPGQDESLFEANPTLDAATPWVESQLTTVITNDAPAGLSEYVTVRLDEPDAPAGSTSTLVHVYGPVDAQFLSASVHVNGRELTPIPFVLGSEAGRPVWGSALDLNRGDTGRFTVRFVEPDREGGQVLVPGTSRPVQVTNDRSGVSTPCGR